MVSITKTVQEPHVIERIEQQEVPTLPVLPQVGGVVIGGSVFGVAVNTGVVTMTFNVSRK